MARRRSAPRPAIRPPARGPGGGRGEGGGRAGAQRHSLGLQPGRAGKDTGSLEWPRTEPRSRGCRRQKPGRKGKGERGEGSKPKDTSSRAKTHAPNDTLKSLGPASSWLPGGSRAAKPSLLGLFFLGVPETGGGNKGPSDCRRGVLSAPVSRLCRVFYAPASLPNSPSGRDSLRSWRSTLGAGMTPRQGTTV